MIDIDHGNDLVTRYAHLSKVLAKEGDVLQRGRRIADSGNTGRSTGPHLHFEVRFRGAPQNPSRLPSRCSLVRDPHRSTRPGHERRASDTQVTVRQFCAG